MRKLKITTAPFKQIDNRWSEIKMQHPFSARSAFAFCAQGDIGYLHGGYNTDQGILKDMYMAKFNDPDDRQWYPIQQKGKPLPGKMKGHTLAAYHCYLICIGGQKSQTQNNEDVYKFNLKTNTWSKINLIHQNQEQIKERNYLKRDSHCSFLHKNYLYVFGGYLSDIAEYSNDVLRFNLEKLESQNQISVKLIKFENNNVPSPRSNFASCMFNKSAYIFGGIDDRDVLNDFWKFDCEKQIWEKMGPQENSSAYWPQKRKGAVIVPHLQSQCLILFGGLQKITKQLNQLAVYLTHKNTWVKIHSNTDKIYEPSPTIKQQLEYSPTIINHKNKRTPNKQKQFHLEVMNVGVSNKSLPKNDRNKSSNGARNYKSSTKTQFSHKVSKTQSSLIHNSFTANSNSPVFSKTEYAGSEKVHKMSVVQQKRYRQFLTRKKKLLSEIYVGYKTQKNRRPFSPTSECLNYTLTQLGQQNEFQHQRNPEFNIPKVIFDDKKSMVIGKKPCARDGHCAFGIDQNMYIIGGDRHTVSFNDTHLLRMDKAIESLNYYT